MAEAPVRVPWKTARKRARQTKERVQMRNFGQIVLQNQQETQEELSLLRNSGAEAGSVQALSMWLENSLTLRQPKPVSVFSAESVHFPTLKFLEGNLVFRKVKDSDNNPFLQLPFAEGNRISRKLSFFFVTICLTINT